MSRVRDFQNTVETAGLWTALRALNAQTPYRYSAVFRFEGEDLRNVCLVDRQDQAVRTCPDQPIGDSYCIYVQRSGRSFDVADSMADARVAGHPKREAFHSYYGVPLLAADGRLLGTVCHFDTAAVQVTGPVVSDLDDIAPVIARMLAGPP
jgi:GAF domain-containing protein